MNHIKKYLSFLSENQDFIVKIDLKKLSQIWNPFESKIWIKVNKPITREEISHAIEIKDFLDVGFQKKMYLIWDESTREEHIQRIAWLVENYNENYPLDIDFGVPSLGGEFTMEDGNHRLAAAIYLNKPYILANVCGSQYEIEKFIYKE